MSGRRASRTGVRTRLAYKRNRPTKKAGPGSLPAPRFVPRLVVGLVVVDAGLDLDGLELELAAAPLQAVLATDARLNLRQRAQPSGGDLLAALHARAVLTVVQAVERGGDAVDPLHQQFARGEPDLAPLVGLDLVHFIGVRPVLAWAQQLFESRRPTHPAQPPHHFLQVRLQPLPDVHCLASVCFGAAVGATAVPYLRRRRHAEDSFGKTAIDRKSTRLNSSH